MFNGPLQKIGHFVDKAEKAGDSMNKLASWESFTGTKATIESNSASTTVSFPLKSAPHQNDADVPKNLTETRRKTLSLENAEYQYDSFRDGKSSYYN